MKKKLLILDKDGTIIRPRGEHKFVKEPSDQYPIDGALDAIERYRKNGWVVAIASNQGGVHYGHKTLDEAVAEMQLAMTLFDVDWGIFAPEYDKEQGKAILIRRTKAGYWSIGVNSSVKMRKPEPGMLKVLMMHIDGLYHDAEWDDVLMVGDRPEDEEAAMSASVRFLDADVWRKGEDISLNSDAHGSETEAIACG